MKVIIPLAGLGKRLRPHTYITPKPLLSVAGKPILAHILDKLKGAVKELVLVLDERGGEIRKYVQENYSFQLQFVTQRQREGLGHAIYLTREFIFPQEPILIILGDTIFEGEIMPILSKLSQSAIGVSETKEPKRFGIVALEGEKVKYLIEKPDNPPSNLALVGLYYITNPSLLFECLEEIIKRNIRSKGEYQLTDALQKMLERGEVITTFQISHWYDCGTVEALLEANQRLLEKLPCSPKTNFESTVLIPPVYIHPTACIYGSVIGPHVSIGKEAFLKDVRLRDTIVGEKVRIEGVILSHSLVPAQAHVKGKEISLNISELSTVYL